jgi:BirA family biotin operon repressor/biotin-[acetyl-CoA-carboxylase] ligase
MITPQDRRFGQHDETHVGWGCQQLWDRINPLWPGLAVEVLARIGSTNTEVIDRLRLAGRGASHHDNRADDLHPTLLVAVHQTQGRGRLGRTWHADPLTSLAFTLAVPLNRPDWSGLSLAVGVAVARAIDPSGQHIRLKWPNDLWLPDGKGSGRKLGGLLIEAIAVGPQRVAVVGVGLNVMDQHHLSAIATVSEFTPEATPASVLAEVGPTLAQALLDFEQGGFAAFANEFAARDLLAGANVITTDPTCPEGQATGVAPDGALLVQHDGVTHRIVSGEVSVRPVPQRPAR